MRRIDDDERRARLGIRHGLASEHHHPDVVASARALCGLHATDPVAAFLAPRARVDGFRPQHLEAALYDERSVVRMLGMRRTVFVLPVELAPLIHQACTAKIAAANRRRLTKLVESSAIDADGDRWLSEVERQVIAALQLNGDSLAVELSTMVPALTAKVSLSQGKPYGADVAVNNQVLTQLAAEGRIVRGRPEGRWTSTRYRWASMVDWVDQPLDLVAPIAAEAELAQRWLATYGPARESDLRWWSGWTVTQTRRALAAIRAVEVELDAGTGWVLADDIDDVPAPEPWVALLPALDPAAMGWTEREWFLGAHREQLFDRTGNIGPTIWADGRIVGGWAQRPDGEVVCRLLDDVGHSVSDAISDEARAVERWLGDVRFKPKFRTPLEKDLTKSP
jgi:hypothetical protein